MIERLSRGDIFKSKAQWLVCPVNRVGVMGCGLALAFKNRFPGLFSFYAVSCHAHKFELNGLVFFKDHRPPHQTVVCFPSKRHFAEPSYMEDIAVGLIDLLRYADIHKPERIGLPMVGCGRGELDAATVFALMEEKLQESETVFEIYY